MGGVLLAMVIGSWATLAGPAIQPDGCTFDGVATACTSTTTRTETVERTMVGECPPEATGAPNSRARAYVDTYAVTEQTVSRQGSDGQILDIRTVETGRALVASQLVADACVPSP